MSKRLFVSAISKFLLGVVLVGFLVFLPGGFDYVQGWIFMALLFIPMFIAGIVMMIFSPELLAKRLSAKEERGAQQTVVKLSGLMFVLGFVAAGLDHRFGWFPIPLWVSIAAGAIFLLAYALYAEVLRENAYLSRTIEVQENQKVIDTGLYGIVRHPMYMATLVLFLSIPILLGSLISLVFFLMYPAIIISRLKDEEKFLAAELEGYEEYMKRVIYRLIPFIW